MPNSTLLMKLEDNDPSLSFIGVDHIRPGGGSNEAIQEIMNAAAKGQEKANKENTDHYFKEFHVEESKRVTSEAADYLAQLGNFRRLDFPSCKIDDVKAAIKIVQSQPNLEDLDLSDNGLKGRDLIAAIANHPNLKMVTLTGNEFKDEDVEPLFTNTKITLFLVGLNSISNQMLEKIEQHTQANEKRALANSSPKEVKSKIKCRL